MTGAELQQGRRQLGLSVRGLAVAAGWTANSGGREMRRYEAGKKPVPDVIAAYVQQQLLAKAKNQ